MKNMIAKWIWDGRSGKDTYNQSIVAEREFSIRSFDAGFIRITADSYYRLYVNDAWVCDGPSRAWPEHYQYDNVDITSYLCDGANKVRVVARYFGIGTFHQVPTHPGLLAQIDITRTNGKLVTIITDKKWQTSKAKFLAQDTPKISIQMEAAELYDATLEGKEKFTAAVELFDTNGGPWKDLKERDVAMLTRNPVNFTKFLSATKLTDDWDIWCVPFRKVLFPGLIEANRCVNSPVAFATFIDVKKPCTVEISAITSVGIVKSFMIDGKVKKNGSYKLTKGRHTAIIFEGDNLTHSAEISLLIKKNPGIKLVNPLKDDFENPWVMAKFSEYDFIHGDLNWNNLLESDADCKAKFTGFEACKKDVVKAAKKVDSFVQILSDNAKCMPSNKMFVRDGHVRFMNAQRGETVNVDNPQALFYDNPETTKIAPVAGGSVELVYDLGIQRCGYYNFELLSEAGVEVDIYGVEYMTPGGKVQHTNANRNGMTYITKEGVNDFVSFKRRSGRYLFVSLRNMTKPVHLRHLGVIESTYPVEYRGTFNCSDAALNKIWEISATTLKLCMEDTFTDCPLYEQTLWVGDARNESLFAYQIFGAEDIARRCVEVNAQSLERYPLAGAQVPSSWDCIIPAWSFLWGISVWEHYWYTGDKKWLKSMWPYMLKNIKGAAAMLDDNGLMSCDFWNFFDWTEIDANQKVVLYNSMLLIGAINAAIDAADVVGTKKQLANLTSLKSQLKKSINSFWDKKRGAYPDSIHDDGKLSESVCQHTSFLAYLYGISSKANEEAVIKNMINPPKKMVKVGSPFAIMYLFEALEKAGRADKVIESIKKNYMPMLDADATTVWESFATGSLSHDDFPTRSHCHAWSSAPIYFFTRIILGVRQTQPGGAEYQISPWVEGLRNAAGTVATHLGDIKVAWTVGGNNLNISYSAPEGVKLKFVKNSSFKGLKVSKKKA